LQSHGSAAFRDVWASLRCRVRSVTDKRGNLWLLSRALFAVLLAALVGVIVRLRGSGGTPPHHGGWRELSVEDLEPMDKQ